MLKELVEKVGVVLAARAGPTVWPMLRRRPPAAAGRPSRPPPQLNSPGVLKVDPSDCLYGNFQGLPRLRSNIAEFLQEYTRSPTPVNPAHICIMNGTGTVIDTLTQVRPTPRATIRGAVAPDGQRTGRRLSWRGHDRRQVLCDPGDGMLIPTPFYGGFETDLEKRAGARCWEVQSSVGSGFHVGVPELEAALAAAQRAGAAAQTPAPRRVRGRCPNTLFELGSP